MSRICLCSLLCCAAALAATGAHARPFERRPTFFLPLANPAGGRASSVAVTPKAAPATEASACPPTNFSSVDDFDVKGYIAAPWYVQKQLPLSYQPPDTLYCVTAEYELRDPANVSAGLIVNNFARTGAVNGTARGSSKYDRQNFTLVALPANTPNASDAQLLVGPELLLRMLPGGRWREAFGPYWVVAVGPSANATLKYDWAIVSGGAPAFPAPAAPGKCTTLPPSNPATGRQGATPGAGGMGPMGGAAARPMDLMPQPAEDGGLWFFSRSPVDPAATAVMEQRAAELGLDTSMLLPVVHEGCRYGLQ